MYFNILNTTLQFCYNSDNIINYRICHVVINLIQDVTFKKVLFTLSRKRNFYNFNKIEEVVLLTYITL